MISLGCYDQALYTFWAEGRGKDKEGKPVVELVPTCAYTPHIGAVTALAGHSATLVSGSTDETMKIYDLRKRVEVGRLDQHTGTVTHIALSQDGAHMVSVGADNTLCIWRTKDWECTRVIENVHRKGVCGLALHPSGLAAVTIGGDGAFRMWDLVKGRQVFVSKEFRAPSEVAWDRAGQKIAVACGRSLVVKDAGNFADASLALECPAQISSLEALSPGKFAVGLASGTVMVWDVAGAEGKCVASLEGTHKIRVRGLAYYKDGAPLGLSGGVLVSASTDGKVVLWDSNKWTPVVSHETDSRITCAVCTSFDVVETVTVVDDDDEEEEEEEEEEKKEVAVVEEKEEEEKKKKKKKQQPLVAKRGKVIIEEEKEEVDDKKKKRKGSDGASNEPLKKKPKKKNNMKNRNKKSKAVNNNNNNKTTNK